MPGNPRTTSLLAVSVLALWVAARADAQAPEPNRGVLSGRVLDIATSEALPFTRVTLVPQPTGVLPTSVTESNFLVAARSVITDSRGAYGIPGVVEGSYRLYVRRIGYRPAILDLDLEGNAGLHLSVGLTVAPIRLEPLNTTAPDDTFGRDEAARPDENWDRAERERWRQDTFLESDVRAMSYEDVVEAVPLGETDILRALQRLPGVTTRDDWTAELWVRGAPASQTRVQFDGMPLFNPVHAGGLTSAVSVDGLGAVFLHPGVRPAHLGGGGAAVVDMKSRSAGGTGDVKGHAHLSTSNLGVQVERRWNDGRVGTLIAARRSGFNRTRDLVRDPDGLSPEIPNDYADVLGRVDVDIGKGRALEFSWLWERDWIDGAIAGGPAGNTSTWGSLVAQSTFQIPLAGGIYRQTLGFSHFGSVVRQIVPKTPLAAFDSLPTQEPTNNKILYASLNGNWTLPDASGLGPKWRWGYNLFHEGVSYRGAPPNPYSIPVYLYTAEIDGQVEGIKLWAERWWRPSDQLTIRAGLRLQFDGFESVGGLLDERIQIVDGQLSPQLALRYGVTDRLSVSVATGRHYQYEQAIAPSGLRFGPGLSSSPIWILPPNARSAARTDMSTVGMEYWLGETWLASANYYDRSISGLGIPDPHPGPIEDDVFTVPADNHAKGVELGVRRLVGRWTGSLGYTLAQSTYDAHGLRFPAPSDRRHKLDVTAMARILDRFASGSMRVGATFTAASGAPFTRIHPGWYDCTNYVPGGHCTSLVPTLVEQPNAERSPWYSGFNVLIDWSRSFNGWNLGAHMQIQNLLNAPQAVTYAVNAPLCRRPSNNSAFCGAAEDGFLPGLRRHYELGLRLAF